MIGLIRSRTLSLFNSKQDLFFKLLIASEWRKIQLIKAVCVCACLCVCECVEEGVVKQQQNACNSVVVAVRIRMNKGSRDTVALGKCGNLKPDCLPLVGSNICIHL